LDRACFEGGGDERRDYNFRIGGLMVGQFDIVCLLFVIDISPDAT
jgi:hypothetical protein